MAALTSTVAFAMAAITTSHLRLAQRHANRLDALYLAETAIAQAVAAVHANRQYGVSGVDEVRYRPDPSDDGCEAVVTFRRGAGPLFSTNNVDGTGAAAGCDGPGTVAAGAVQIVATGRSHGQELVIEATLAVPAFPYVMAASGAVEADALVVAGATSLQEFYKGEQDGRPSTRPADLAANVSLKVNDRCDVSGDLLTLQLLGLPTGDRLRVGGAIRTAAADLPDLPLARFDPSSDASASVLDSGQYAGLAVEPGTCLARPPSGTLTIAGDLSMDHGVLYVKGNVEIQGGVTGRGAIIAEGDAVIRGGANLSSDSLLALLCGGEANLSGSGPGKYFQGLVYAKGGLQASNLTVAGTTIVGAGSNGRGGVRLTSAPLVHLPEASQLVIDTAQAEAVEPAFVFGIVVFQKTNGSGASSRQEVVDAARGALQGTPLSLVVDEFPDRRTSYLCFSTLPLPNGDKLCVAAVRGGEKDASGHLRLFDSTYRITTLWPQGDAHHPQGLDPETAEQLTRGQGMTLDQIEARLRDAQDRAVAKSNEILDRVNTETATHHVRYDFGINQFLRDTMPVRIIAWRER